MPRKLPPSMAMTISGLLMLIALASVWDWNWLRPWVEHQASILLGRSVTLRHFDVKLRRNPTISADGIVIDNPPDFPANSAFFSAQRVSVQIDPWRLLHRELRLLSIDIQSPRGDLQPGPGGMPNWKFTFPAGDGPGMTLIVGALSIADGKIHVLDPEFKSDFNLQLSTLPVADDSESRLRVEAEGRYAGQPITGRFIGGSVLSLRERDKPYPLDLELSNGATRIELKGSLQDPLQLAGADLDLRLRGNDLAALYPLTGVPLPPTAAYQLKGKLDYGQKQVRFSHFLGTVGGSDLSGDIQVDLSGVRRLVTANLVSNKVVLADLAGFIGATPGKTGAVGESKEQEVQRANEAASPRVLPDRPINLPRIQAADLDVRYHGKRIESESTPFDNLNAHLIIKEGFLSLRPLSFGIGRGQIAANIEIDGRKSPVHTVADVDFRQIDLKQLVQKSNLFKGTGLIGGSARIDATGNSFADALGRGDGELKLFMHHGELSAVLVNLAGLEFGKALLSALGIPAHTQIRCVVSDFELKKGVLNTRALLVDTGEANIIGDGSINLRDELLDYRIHSQPKRIGIGSLRAPILISGPFKDPSIRPDYKTLAVRSGAALALGIFLTPLAALLPTMELGLGEDNDCKSLVKSVRAAATPVKK